MLHFSEFTRHVLTLTKGTVFSQVILIAATPVLTRLYDVAAFGEQQLFAFYYTFFVGMLTLKLEQAIVLEANDRDANALVRTIVIISVSLSVIALLFIVCIREFFSESIGIWYYLLPLALVSGAIYSVTQQWFSRKKRFGFTSRSGMINSAVNITVSLGLGMLPAFGFNALVIGYSAGLFVSATFLLVSFARETPGLVCSDFHGLGVIIRKHARFSIYLLPTTLLGIASSQLITPMMEAFFGTQALGYYSMANRFLVLPTILVGSSIGDVFRVELARIKHEKGDSVFLFSQVLKKLVLLGIPTFVLLATISPQMFSILLGEGFSVSGRYAQYLCAGLLAQFVIQPINHVFVVLGKMKTYFALQFCFMAVPVVSVLTGRYLFFNIESALIVYSILSVIFSIVEVLIARNVIKKNAN